MAERKHAGEAVREGQGDHQNDKKTQVDEKPPPKTQANEMQPRPPRGPGGESPQGRGGAPTTPPSAPGAYPPPPAPGMRPNPRTPAAINAFSTGEKPIYGLIWPACTANSSPATAANPEPIAKAVAITRLMLMPISRAASRSSAAARMDSPSVVRVTNSESSTSSTTP